MICEGDIVTNRSLATRLSFVGYQVSLPKNGKAPFIVVKTDNSKVIANTYSKTKFRTLCFKLLNKC